MQEFPLAGLLGTGETVHAEEIVLQFPDGRSVTALVDDDPQVLRYVRDTLVSADYQPLVTGDPEEAVRPMNKERPRAALVRYLSTRQLMMSTP